MLSDPSTKYSPYAAVALPGREWPFKRITHHPVWLSTDLRDGNQALSRPMTADQKLRFFRHLVQCRFKEIEIGYPASSDTEFNFVRRLIDDGEIPDDVWIQVMTAARADLIGRTFEATAGARQVIISLFNSTAPCFREVVFRKSKEEIIDLAVRHTIIVRQLADEYRDRYGTRFRLAYGIEAFSQTEPEYVIEICSAVKRAWGLAGPGDDRIMYNLPSTVEMAPPNHYADQIEYFCKHIPDRNEVMVSLHCHNDRGTAVAATELGLLAGADRVEGCLLGNGERSGNVDLVTVALNMYTQGVPCGLDFSNIQSTIDLVTELTSIPVHPRHPYAGELIFTAFSGQHQDGIKKGLEAQVARHALAKRTGQPLLWDVPYLPLDPADIGRTYEAVIRVNSQSGKGGVAYVVKERLKIDLPRAVQQDFYRVVQEQTERRGCEMSPDDIAAAFRETYHFPGSHSHAGMSLAGCVVSERMQDGTHIVVFEGAVVIGDTTYVLHGEGASLASAVVEALHTRLGVSRYLVEAHTSPADGGGVSAFTSFVLLSEREEERSPVPCTWGVGMDPSAPRSTVLAVVSAVNRTLGSSPSLVPATTIMSWKDVMRVLQTDYRLHLPDGMHDTLSKFCVDGSARCMSAAQLAARFIAHYCYGSSKEPSPCRGMRLCSFSITNQTGPVRALQLDATIELHGAQKSLSCAGADVVSCFLSAVSDDLGALQVREVVVSPPTGREDGSGAGYASFVRLASLTDGSHEAWGIGVDTDITTSMLKATLVSAVNASTVAQAPSSESPLGVVI